MKFNNKFIIGWWVMLLVVFGAIIIARFDNFTSDELILFDYIILVLLFILVFLPLYSEMSMFGFSLKREIESVEESVDDLKSLIVSNTNSNVVYLNTDPHLTEQQKEEIKRNFKAPKARNFEAAHAAEDNVIEEFISNEKTVINFFAIRYLLEKEIRRIAVSHVNAPNSKPMIDLIRILANRGVIEPYINNALLEVWSITSRVVHGELIRESDKDFVAFVGEPLAGKLKQLK